MTNRRRVGDNNNISQLLRDSFSVSQQPPIWEPPSHYSMLNIHITPRSAHSTQRCSVNSENARCRFPATAQLRLIFNLLIGGRGLVIPSHDMSPVPVWRCGRIPPASARLPGAGLLDSDLCLSPVSSQPEPEPEPEQSTAAAAARQLTRRHTAPPPHNTDTGQAQELKSSSSNRGSLEDQVEFN